MVVNSPDNESPLIISTKSLTSFAARLVKHNCPCVPYNEAPKHAREQKPYVWDIIDTIHREQLVAIEKSRQLFVTWIVCLYCLWSAKFHKNRLIFVQSKKEED